MRITASFCTTRPRLATALAAASWTAAAALVGLAAGLAMSARELRAELPRLELRHARVQAELQRAGKPELPSAGELEALRAKVQALNKVAGLRGWSTPQLLGWLGAQLPDDVYLVSLAHRPREGEALLVAESASAESLTAFLLRLEKEPRFAEVLLGRQGVRGGPGASALQFEIRVRWKA